MSTEPEELLEQALRGDFPSADAEARVRRRLLAAGVAIGNGVATSTAAGASAGAASAAAKLGGLSWGLKLGLAAVVTIPTVGLWLDGRAERPSVVRAAAPPARALVAPTPAAESTTPARPSSPVPETDPAVTARERPQPHAGKPAAADEIAANEPPSRAHPSQAEFVAPEVAAPAPSASTLAEETRLLDAAFAQLTAGNLTRAAALIREHETRFPTGLLRRERERAKTRLLELSRGE